MKKNFKELITEVHYFRQALEKENLEIDDIDYQVVQAKLGEVSQRFPKKLSFILDNYFGLNNNDIKTIKEIADIMGRSSTMVQTNLCKGLRRALYNPDVMEYIIGTSNIFPERYKKKDFGFYYDNIQNTIFYGNLQQTTKDSPIYYYNIPQRAYGCAYMIGEYIYYDEAILQSDIDKIKADVEKINNVETKEQHLEFINKEKKKKTLENSIEKKKEQIKKLQAKIKLYEQDIVDLEEEKEEVEKWLIQKKHITQGDCYENC